MKGRVAIVGMGISEAGLRPNASQEDLIVEAGHAALDDAGMTARDIQASWFGCTTVSANHALLNFSLKLDYTGMTKVSAGGATGAEVLRAAYTGVASGQYDIVLAAGVEKPTDAGFTEFQENEGMGPSAVGADAVAGEFRAPVHSGMYLTRYAATHGVEAGTLREALSRITARSRRAGTRNPKAALRFAISDEDLAQAPLSVAPMTTLDCTKALDGSAAAIICNVDVAKRLGRPYIVLEGIGVASGGSEGRLKREYDYTGIPESRIAAGRAYAMAGISDPAREIDHAEIFDLTSAAELLAYEDLGLAPRGRAVELAIDGFFDVEGRIPTNTDGGLLCNGYQAGASGLRQVHESYLQLLGRAGERQVPGVRRSLVHSIGGATGSFIACVQIFGLPEPG